MAAATPLAMTMGGDGDKGRRREMRFLLPLSPLFIVGKGRPKDQLYTTKEPTRIRLIKVAAGEAIDCPPRPIGGAYHIPCVCHLPHAVHAAYMVQGAGIMGDVENK